jgi:thiol-disulfide isomerase/thioredoxin
MSAISIPEETKHLRRFLRSAALTLVATQLGILGGEKVHSAAVPRLQIEGELPPFDSTSKWLNSQPTMARDLRGKVVLINFWTYTCINWQRQLPYIRAWAQKYKDHGLVVIGVHAPEFGFEHNVDNVRRAAKDLRVEYERAFPCPGQPCGYAKCAPRFQCPPA